MSKKILLSLCILASLLPAALAHEGENNTGTLGTNTSAMTSDGASSSGAATQAYPSQPGFELGLSLLAILAASSALLARLR